MAHQLNDAFLNAVRENNLENVENFLNQGVNINYRDIDEEGEGESGLYRAAKNGNLGIVNAIIQRNPDINIQTDFGDTPLHIASRNGHTDIATALINAGADVNAQNIENETPLHLAVVTVGDNYNDVIHKLIDHGARTDITTLNGNTALDLAEINNNEGAIKILETSTKMPMTSKAGLLFEKNGINPDNHVETFRDMSRFLGETEGGKKRKTKKVRKTNKKRKNKRRKTNKKRKNKK
jgi:hypothetical protein